MPSVDLNVHTGDIRAQLGTTVHVAHTFQTANGKPAEDLYTRYRLSAGASDINAIDGSDDFCLSRPLFSLNSPADYRLQLDEWLN